MKDLGKMRERFQRDGKAVRLGNLASELRRLGGWIQSGRDDDVIVDLMRKIAWLMEWMQDGATREIADMQREICRWRRIWPLDEARSLLAFRARNMSDQLLEQSGLLSSGKMGTG